MKPRDYVRLSVVASVTAIASAVALTAVSAAEPPLLGGAFTPDPTQDVTGCLSRRALMYVSRVEPAGTTDKTAAGELRRRDCFRLAAGDTYIRCAEGGTLFLDEERRESFSGYCRAGRAEPQLFVCDSAMQAADQPATR